MDNNLYSNSPRFRKFTTARGDMAANTRAYIHPSIERGFNRNLSNIPVVDPYALRYEYDLMKLLRSNSPVPVSENLGPITPVQLNLEEETVVYDGIPLELSCGGSASAYSHSKRPVCRAVEDNISSFPGSKHRLIRGKEERHLSRFSLQNDPPGIASPGRLRTHKTAEAVKVAVPEQEAPRIVAAPPSKPTQVHKPHSLKVPTRDWSPLDDGILAYLPSQPTKPLSREDLDAYTHYFRDRPRAHGRLPVFAEITDQEKPIAWKRPL